MPKHKTAPAEEWTQPPDPEAKHEDTAPKRAKKDLRLQRAQQQFRKLWPAFAKANPEDACVKHYRTCQTRSAKREFVLKVAEMGFNYTEAHAALAHARTE